MAPRNTSEMTIIFLLFKRSTHAPAMGPTMNTGIIVNDMSLASAISEPGLRRYTSATSAIWFRRSPKFDITCPSQRKKKFLFVSTSRKRVKCHPAMHRIIILGLRGALSWPPLHPVSTLSLRRGALSCLSFFLRHVHDARP